MVTTEFEYRCIVDGGAADAPPTRAVTDVVERLLSAARSDAGSEFGGTLLVWADDLVSARVSAFGRRLDEGARVTARQSVDLEVTESFRALRSSGRGWPGPLWVCAGSRPGVWAAVTDWCMEITRVSAEGGNRWEAILRREATSTSPASDVVVTSCVLESRLGKDFTAHAECFRTGPESGLTSESVGDTAWIGADAVSAGGQDAWTKIVAQALQEAGVARAGGVVVLGAAQYAAGPGDPEANVGFGAPRQIHLGEDGDRVAVDVHVLSHACASVLYATELARWILADPAVEAVVVVGVSVPSRAAEDSMRAVRALSPTTARPFSPDREGITLGAGGGGVVLQRRETATVPPLASLSGVATRVAAPTSSSQSVDDVLDTLSRCCPGAAGAAVDVVIAHATGTPVGDPVELATLETFFQAGDEPLAVVSHKGVTGHLLHASGILGIGHAVALLGQEDVAGTWLLAEAQGVGRIQVLPGGASDATVRHHRRARPIASVVVNALGFGGNTASIQLSIER